MFDIDFEDIINDDILSDLRDKNTDGDQRKLLLDAILEHRMKLRFYEVEKKNQQNPGIYVKVLGSSPLQFILITQQQTKGKVRALERDEALEIIEAQIKDPKFDYPDITFKD